MTPRTAGRVVAPMIAVLALGFFLVRTCADGGAMGSAYRACRCIGLEWTVYDRTAADGPRRTLCLGLTASRSCHQFREGPLVACPE